MLQLLTDNYLEKTIALTGEFKHDLQWFKNFLKIFNGTSIYNHSVIRHILLAFRAFSPCWKMKRLLIKSDNDAVVKVLNTVHTYDPFLGACARNIWFQTALMDLDVKYVHVPGVKNRTADLLSRWDYSPHSYQKLGQLVDFQVWLDVL